MLITFVIGYAIFSANAITALTYTYHTSPDRLFKSGLVFISGVSTFLMALCFIMLMIIRICESPSNVKPKYAPVREQLYKQIQ